MFDEMVEPSPYHHKPPMRFKKYEIFYNRDYIRTHMLPHTHQYYEFYFLQSGQITFHIEGHGHALSAGDIVLVSPNQEHHVSINSTKVPYVRYVLWLDPAFVDSLSSTNTNLSSVFKASCIINSRLRLPDNLRSRIGQLFKSIFISSQSQRYGSDLLAGAYITELLVRVAQSSLFSLNSSTHYGESVMTNKNSMFMLSVLRYIDEHIHEEVHVNDICNQFFVSRSHLSKIFSEEIGLPVYSYIMKKKLFLAKQDIASGMAIQDIAEQYNFGNYSSFYRAFRNEFGQSPQSFKNELDRTAF